MSEIERRWSLEEALRKAQERRDWTFDADGNRAQRQAPRGDSSPAENYRRRVYFGGGCDCGCNPTTCGTGHFCRWQY